MKLIDLGCRIHVPDSCFYSRTKRACSFWFHRLKAVVVQVDWTDEVLSNMGDSGDSSSASDCGSPQPKGGQLIKSSYGWKRRQNVHRVEIRGYCWIVRAGLKTSQFKETIRVQRWKSWWRKILLDLRQLTWIGRISTRALNLACKLYALNTGCKRISL